MSLVVGGLSECLLASNEDTKLTCYAEIYLKIWGKGEGRTTRSISVPMSFEQGGVMNHDQSSTETDV